VIVDGEVVVDLVGGWADESGQRLWKHDTLVNYYSVGKALVALLALQLVDDGVLGLDDPIASVWPEFAAAGKEAATVRHALCHRAGVPAIREPLTNDDLWNWERMTAALAATEPWFEPGTRHTYHTNTYGHLVGEIVRRASGDMPGTRLRAVAESIDADVWCGVPATEQHRCADVMWAPANAIRVGDISKVTGEQLMLALGYFNPPGYSSTDVVNTAEWRGAQVPSTNGHGSASGVARIYDALLAGRLLSSDLLVEATRAQSVGYCPVLGEDVTFGLGFKPTVPHRPFGPNPRSFGHFGTGGAVGYADPDARVAFGYVMNHVIPRWQSTRNRALSAAVYASL
jgi:CubicO group peptidase (beta-lactamase class C family)